MVENLGIVVVLAESLAAGQLLRERACLKKFNISY
jgi:hypothetical protein